MGVLFIDTFYSTLYNFIWCIISTHSIYCNFNFFLQKNHLSLFILYKTEESPTQAIRRKKDSSMVVGLNLVKEKTINSPHLLHFTKFGVAIFHDWAFLLSLLDLDTRDKQKTAMYCCLFCYIK